MSGGGDRLNPRDEDAEWVCSKPGCTLKSTEHSLALAIEHIYGGAPTKDGRDFNRDESKEVADRILDRLREDLA